MTAGTYELLTSSDVTVSNGNTYTSSNSTAKLSALLSTVTNPELTIINTEYGNTVFSKESDANNWYSAKWRTAVYDFKTRKFECTSVHYNDSTGYVDEICFAELST
jgi:hypothetical protein